MVIKSKEELSQLFETIETRRRNNQGFGKDLLQTVHYTDPSLKGICDIHGTHIGNAPPMHQGLVRLGNAPSMHQGLVMNIVIDDLIKNIKKIMNKRGASPRFTLKTEIQTEGDGQ